jgi:putative nucleotidyltransferase with HDIG domain
MPFLKKQWSAILTGASEVDITFLLLRVFSLVGGVVWLLIVPLSPEDKSTLITALIFFSIYSVLCYLIIFFSPRHLDKVYLASLFFDMIFLSGLVHAETNFENSFFLGYYLLISLHTIYFGLRFGLLVAVISAISYTLSIFSMLTEIEWTDFAIRIGFLFFIALPVGLLTEKVKRDKEKVEHFNETLETIVAQRMDKIGTLLDQERYLREILSTVAHINKLLITAPTVISLLENACTRFVQHNHYDFSWIGILQEDIIQTVYTSDRSMDSLISPPYPIYDPKSILYQSPAARCIRANKTIIRKNDQKRPDQTPWLNPKDARSFHAVISLPLRAHHTAPPLGVLTIYTLRKEGFEREEQDMLDELAGDIGFAIDSFRQRESVTKLTAERTANYEETIFSFVDMIEQRDTYTAGHTERVAQYSEKIAREMGVDRGQREKLYKAAILHDIGKIATPDSVLLKPGKLTSLDYDLIKLHPTAGYEMLSKIEMYHELAVIILHHHERYDGKGYPDHLKGDEIPLLSRIMTVGDAFDAMTTNRIYKAKKEIPEALAELKEFSGSQFHPQVVKAAVKVLADIKISTSINQLPVSSLEKKRFSYFFNDMLTGLHNENYLKIILNNLDLNKYTCLHMLHLLNVPEYNKRHGWARGNQFFKEFAAELQASFPEALAFRAYGNDFAFISKVHIETDSETLNNFQCIRDNEINVEVYHIDLLAEKTYTIDKLEKMEILTLDEIKSESEK